MLPEFPVTFRSLIAQGIKKNLKRNQREGRIQKLGLRIIKALLVGGWECGPYRSNQKIGPDHESLVIRNYEK